MQHLSKHGTKWNSTDTYANYGAFVIEKMATELDPVRKPDLDLS